MHLFMWMHGAAATAAEASTHLHTPLRAAGAIHVEERGELRDLLPEGLEATLLF